MTDSRSQQILNSVDNLLRVHDEWEADETQPVHLTAAFEHAINEAITVCENGDIPEECRDLHFAMSKLAVEWDKYSVGAARTPDHRPLSSFWGAFRDVITTRESATPKEFSQPEPVCILMQQNVTHYQIANHIWGYRGKGPFLTSSGGIDSMKLMEEAKEPGKYTKDWVHPEQLERVKEDQRKLQRRIGRVTDREVRDTRTIEKASVVEMLKEGQYPDVIARVKGLSLDTVLEEAKRFGITPAVRPNLAAMRSEAEKEPFVGELATGNTLNALQGRSQQQDNIIDPGDGDEDGVDEDDEDYSNADADEFGAEELPQLADAELIVQLNDGTRGVAEIVAAAKKDGRKLTANQVKKVLAKSQEKATA